MIFKQFKLIFWTGYWIPWKLDKNGLLVESSQFILLYGILIAEFMLQHTQLKVVLPYWENGFTLYQHQIIYLIRSTKSFICMAWAWYYPRAQSLHDNSSF